MRDGKSRNDIKQINEKITDGSGIGFTKTDINKFLSIYPVSNSNLDITVKTLARPLTTTNPTPANPLSLTGHSTLKLYHAGKNLIESRGAASSTTNGITFTKNSNGSISISGTASSDAYYDVIPSGNKIFLPRGIYSFGPNVGSASGTYRLYYTAYKLDGSTLVGIYPYGTAIIQTFLEEVTIKAQILVKNGTTVSATIYPQVEIGVESTAFEPYEGHVYSVTPASTLYGIQDHEDTWDLTTGVITHKTKSVVLNGDEGWANFTDMGTTVRASATVISDSIVISRDKIICDKLVSAFGDEGDWEHISNDYDTAPGKVFIYIAKSRLSESTLTGLTTWLVSNPLTVVYELATPTTQTVTAVTITAVENQNNIHSDGYGTSEIEYDQRVERLSVDKPFKGKVGLVLGDSFSSRSYDVWDWKKYFSDITKPLLINQVAVAGATWLDASAGITYDGAPVTNHINYIGNQVQKILNGSYATPDFIAVFAGTNDTTYTVPTDVEVEAAFYSTGVAVALSALDRSTWAGAMRWSVETLKTKYPDAKIFLLTPCQKTGDKYAEILAKNQIIKKMALRLGVEVIDTMSCSLYDIYTSGDFTDGLHPSVQGAKKIGNFIAKEFINKFNY